MRGHCRVTGDMISQGGSDGVREQSIVDLCARKGINRCDGGRGGRNRVDRLNEK